MSSFRFLNYCKDTLFEAIHNRRLTHHILIGIVLATAKIHFLKQFTTSCQTFSVRLQLCLLLQRYTFWSNSQQSWVTDTPILHCACYCKDTLFEAIHNSMYLQKMIVSIVLATAKIHFLKQFTTLQWVQDCSWLLCLLLQRYTFWSNSQPLQAAHEHEWIVLATAKIHFLKQFTTPATPCVVEEDCACYCKDTLFEAIHNVVFRISKSAIIVLATAKIHFLKQFTTTAVYPDSYFYCACYCKDTLFEAIHNSSPSE